jgi:hypothetical protein
MNFMVDFEFVIIAFVTPGERRRIMEIIAEIVPAMALSQPKPRRCRISLGGRNRTAAGDGGGS